MPKKIIYEDNPWPDVNIHDLEIIADFLPKPWELARMEKKSKITITLSDESVAFFKQQAKKYKTPYQAMIRNLLQHYVMQAQRQKPNRS
ncbi:MAG: BrnA antitoxin family protein [Alphaproteobacteria bacterium]|nr:BrnA antitoxin family protein [Alphaproteobacteria bacterium]